MRKFIVSNLHPSVRWSADWRPPTAHSTWNFGSSLVVYWTKSDMSPASWFWKAFPVMTSPFAFLPVIFLPFDTDEAKGAVSSNLATGLEKAPCSYMSCPFWSPTSFFLPICCSIACWSSATADCWYRGTETESGTNGVCQRYLYNKQSTLWCSVVQVKIQNGNAWWWCDASNIYHSSWALTWSITTVGGSYLPYFGRESLREPTVAPTLSARITAKTKGLKENMMTMVCLLLCGRVCQLKGLLWLNKRQNNDNKCNQDKNLLFRAQKDLLTVLVSKGDRAGRVQNTRQMHYGQYVNAYK